MPSRTSEGPVNALSQNLSSIPASDPVGTGGWPLSTSGSIGVGAAATTGNDAATTESNLANRTSREQQAAKAGLTPAVLLTLLLTSGARHAYRIDDKYLAKRSIHTLNGDPFDISVYTLKELILREWREGELLLWR